MDPQIQFCPCLDCPARGQAGQGNVTIHSRRERRYRCSTCGHTFAATKGTAFYRRHHQQERMALVLNLLVHGCPVQAIVAAFGLDERTVARWQLEAGQHCERVHEHLVQAGAVDAQHVQADELYVKQTRTRAWLAIALAVPFRLFLGAELSERRDQALIRALVRRVRACVQDLGILVCVDGLPSYVTAFLSMFRNPVHTGQVGRPRRVLAEGFQMAQVVKEYAKRRVVGVSRRIVQGEAQAIQARVQSSHGGTDVNTAFIERFNATVRSRLFTLVRRGRAVVHQSQTLRAGVYLLGCAYNFCSYHESLRQEQPDDSGRKWKERTPAMAAGLTDHRWSMTELLGYRVPPPPWVAPKRRGRPPKSLQLPTPSLSP